MVYTEASQIIEYTVAPRVIDSIVIQRADQLARVPFKWEVEEVIIGGVEYVPLPTSLNEVMSVEQL